MSSFASVRRAGCVLAAAALCTLAACAKDLDGGTREVIFVRSALAPPTMNEMDACVYAPNADAPALFEGSLDVGVRDQYNLTLLMQSSDAAVGASVSGAHVVVRTNERILAERDVIANGYIEGGGFGLVSFAAIDPATAHALSEMQLLENRSTYVSVVVETQIRGLDPVGGGAVSSPVFRLPIRVCNGCLVSFAGASDFAYPQQPNCLRPAEAGARRPCTLGQDEAVPCQLCQGKRACDPTAL